MTSTVAPTTALPLTPRLHPTVRALIGQQQMLEDLLQAFGSPLNILLPEIAGRNVCSFEDAFRRHGISGRVYFAHKANQSHCLVSHLSLSTCNIDVASLNELRHALGCGFTADRIEATGPKSRDFLALCIQQGVIVSLDSMAEAQLLLCLRRAISPAAGKPVRVLLRVSGFRSEHSRFLNKGSRFGVPLEEVDACLQLLAANQKEVDLAGFAFHLDTTSVLERTIAVENCFQLFESAIALGFEPRVLNIGGGYKVNYLADAEEWNRYTSALKEGVLGSGQSLTWQGNSFGLHVADGKLRGNFNSYSFFDENTGDKFLDELLEQSLPELGGCTTGSFLADNMIELWIEPGRSLLDQAGITVASVNSIRRSSNGDLIVGLNMKRQDISFLDQEIFVDPIVLRRNDSHAGDDPVAVFFAGNLCLESDLVYRHLTWLSRMPEPGDLIVFANTAGYFMDFSASTAIMQPVARKIAVCERGDRFHWFTDEQYSPFWEVR